MFRHFSPRFLLATTLFLSPNIAINAADKPGQPTVDQPLPPEEAAATMQLPEGFKATLFAGEPDVQQPIGFCIDDRGRLWVAEAYSYPDHTDQPGKDRILIFEDTDNDGRHDKRTVFYDKLNYVSGIEVGFGGAWVMSPPYFYFIPDKNGDDIPDGEPEVLLDGFGTHANSHNIANGFAWGPDGWLYATHGRTNWSMIGKPGAKDDERQRFDGGVWRYHPVRHEWEPYADGTTNPWGIDWNEYGEAFMSNCVNPHLFHVIQGAHYEPWRGRQSSQYAYDRIESIADHLHFVDGAHTTVGTDEVESLGGGHAHCGMMIYQGTNWPEKYRNTVFMNNIHGKRINNDLPERHGSGYIARHGDDFAISKDPWFMGVTLQYGPDGGVFVIDWSDTGECHSVRNTRKETGRIFKITYGDEPLAMPELGLAKRSSTELLSLRHDHNEWLVRHCRRILQERAAEGEPMQELHNQLREGLLSARSTVEELQILWTLHITGGTDAEFLEALVLEESFSENAKAWSLQLLCDLVAKGSPSIGRLAPSKFDSEYSPIFFRYFASALQRLTPEQVYWIFINDPFSTHEDAINDDPNLPYLIWYAVEPLVHFDIDKFVDIGTSSAIRAVRRNTARRTLELKQGVHMPKLIAALRRHLGPADANARKDIFEGIFAGIESQGISNLPMPADWRSVYRPLRLDSNPAVGEAAVRLALVFKDPDALTELKKLASDHDSPGVVIPNRRNALNSLIANSIEDLDQLLLGLISDPQVQDLAIRGLAKCDHPDIATSLIKLAPTLDATARRDAVQTLASRPEWASALLDAVDAGTIEKSDISAFAARQMQNLGDKKLTARLTETWGDLRKPSKDKEKAIASFRKKLTPESIAAADPHKGSVAFQNLCSACHKMFGEGGDVGPEITGSQRKNIDYLLENLIDPSAAVSKDYQLVTIETKDGRFLSGFIRSQNDNALTLQSINEQIVVPLADIKKRTPAEVSIMPEGLLQTMTTEQIRDLFAYLAGPGQVEAAEE